MKILVLNAGSSSLKISVFDTEKDPYPFFKGEFEHFKDNECTFCYQSQKRQEKITSVQEAILAIPRILNEFGYTHFDAVGHRVAHGGDFFHEAVLITDSVLEKISVFTPLAPLHNPVNLKAIEIARSLWKDLSHFAVFDTSFHESIPYYAYTYAIPEVWRNQGIRRYGFHGMSHEYVAKLLEKTLDRSDLKIINCHLGSGASLCAIDSGKSVDTSMGFTPLEGLVMGTRSGDLDPGVLPFLMREMNLTLEEIEKNLYQNSGLKSIAGIFDMREIEQEVEKKNPNAVFAISLYVYRIRKYIGSYIAALGGIDVLSFTAGVGENSSLIRNLVCDKFSFINLKIDQTLNSVSHHSLRFIEDKNSDVKIAVIPACEEWVMAQKIESLLARL